jgi:hypothetical protein
MKTIKFLLPAVLLLILWGCEDLISVFDADKRVFNERDFEAIEISDLAAHVIIRKSSGYDITARGRTQEVGDLKVENINRKLKIRFKNHGNNRRMFTIEISLPNLNSVHFSGAIKGKAEGEFETEKLKIELHGTSDFSAMVKANEISSQMYGTSQLILGSHSLIGLHTTQLFGSSKLEAFELPTHSTYIQAFGTSKGYVNVNHDLIASADGISKVRYKGKPKQVSAKITGLSTIDEM